MITIELTEEQAFYLGALLGSMNYWESGIILSKHFEASDIEKARKALLRVYMNTCREFEKAGNTMLEEFENKK